MNRPIQYLLSICVITLLAACGDTHSKTDQANHSKIEHSHENSHENGQEHATSMMSVNEIITQVEEVHLAARKREHAWTITEKHLRNAREALATGNMEAALVSAQRALKTAKASLSQAENESTAWKGRLLKTKST